MIRYDGLLTFEQKREVGLVPGYEYAYAYDDETNKFIGFFGFERNNPGAYCDNCPGTCFTGQGLYTIPEERVKGHLWALGKYCYENYGISEGFGYLHGAVPVGADATIVRYGLRLKPGQPPPGSEGLTYRDARPLMESIANKIRQATGLQ